MEHLIGKASSITRKIVRIDTQSYEAATQVHLGKMAEIVTEQRTVEKQIQNQIEMGDPATDSMRRLSEIYDRSITERVHGLVRERTLVIFGKKQIPLSSKRS